MSLPNDAPDERARATGVPGTSSGRVKADGTRVYQMTPPQIIWWGWVAAVILSLGDLVIQGHHFISLKFAFVTLAITGVVYACTVWCRVIADQAGIEVRNPFRRFVIPWTAVRGIYLADSVEVQCARAGGKKDKTVYSWALSSPRRARARSQLRAWQWDQGKRSRPSSYSRMPQAAQSLVKMTTAEIMARELAAMSDDARFRSVMVDVELDLTAGDETTSASVEVRSSAVSSVSSATSSDSGGDVLVAKWAWPPLLAIVLPVVGYVITVLVK